MRKLVEKKVPEGDLEAVANKLLAKAKPSEEYPIYTELQLLRSGEGKIATSASHGFDATEIVEAKAPQNFTEELLFLIQVTELTRVERCVLRGWLQGWTQEQIRRAFPQEAGRYSQQHLSRLLREALVKCYSSGVSFDDFSKHTIYRKPGGRKGPHYRMMTCRGCGCEFVFGLGAGRFYCSKTCYEASKH